MLTLRYTLAGTLADFDEAARATFAASLKTRLGCISDACALALQVEEGSVLVTATVSLAASQPALAQAVLQQASALTTMTLAEVSAALGVSVEAVAAIVATGPAVTLATNSAASPPSSPQTLSPPGPARPPPMPPPRPAPLSQLTPPPSAPGHDNDESAAISSSDSSSSLNWAVWGPAIGAAATFGALLCCGALLVARRRLKANASRKLRLNASNETSGEHQAMEAGTQLLGTHAGDDEAREARAEMRARGVSTGKLALLLSLEEEAARERAAAADGVEMAAGMAEGDVEEGNLGSVEEYLGDYQSEEEEEGNEVEQKEAAPAPAAEGVASPATSPSRSSRTSHGTSGLVEAGRRLMQPAKMPQPGEVKPPGPVTYFV